MSDLSDNKKFIMVAAGVAAVAAFLYFNQKKKKIQAGPDNPAWGLLLDKTFKRAERLQVRVNKGLRELLETDHDEHGDMTSISSQFGTIAKEEAEAFIAANGSLFQQLFEEYDTNHDGLLSLEECAQCVRDSMIVVQGALPKYIRKLVELNQEGQKKLFAALSHDEDGDDDDHLDSSPAIDSEVALCIPIGNRIIAQLLAQSDVVAKDIWTAMDADHDGTVSREEFIHHFFSLNQHNVGIGKIWGLIVEERSKH